MSIVIDHLDREMQLARKEAAEHMDRAQEWRRQLSDIIKRAEDLETYANQCETAINVLKSPPQTVAA